MKTDLKSIKLKGGNPLKNIKKFIFSFALAVGLAFCTAAVCSFAALSDNVVFKGHTYKVEEEKNAYVDSGLSAVKIVGVNTTEEITLNCTDFVAEKSWMIISSEVENVKVSHDENWNTVYQNDSLYHYRQCYNCGCDYYEQHNFVAQKDDEGNEIIYEGGEATKDKLGVRDEICKDCGATRYEQFYRGEGENSNPSKFPGEQYISGNVNELSQKITLENGKEVEIIVQDPLEILKPQKKVEDVRSTQKVIEARPDKTSPDYNQLDSTYFTEDGEYVLRVTEGSVALGEDYDGTYGLENQYKANIRLLYRWPKQEEIPAEKADAKNTRILKLRDGEKEYESDDEYFYYPITDFPGGIRVLMEVPDALADKMDDWDLNELIVTWLKEGKDEIYVSGLEHRAYKPDGTFRVLESRHDPVEEDETVRTFATFWTTNLSPKAVIDPADPVDGGTSADSTSSDGDVDSGKIKTLSSKKTGGNIKTGENMDAMYILAGLMSFAAIGIYLTLKKRLELENK